MTEEAGSQETVDREEPGGRAYDCSKQTSRRGLETASLGNMCLGVTDGADVGYFLEGSHGKTSDSNPGDISVSYVLGHMEFQMSRLPGSPLGRGRMTCRLTVLAQPPTSLEPP